MDRLVVGILTDFLRKGRKQIGFYMFEKDVATGSKDCFYLVYLDVSIGKEIKRRVLRGVTRCAKMFDGLGIDNSYDDRDENIVDGFWTAIRRNKDKGSVYSVRGLVSGEMCASGDFKDNS